MDLNKPYVLDQSYARFMYEELFKHINIKKKHPYRTGAPRNRKICQAYEAAIMEVLICSF